MKILIVDDMRSRWVLISGICAGHECAWSKTNADAMARLESGSSDLIFLDYDLWDSETTEVLARVLAVHESTMPPVIIHSDNPLGAARLKALLPDSFLYPVTRMTRSDPSFSRFRQALSVASCTDTLREVLEQALGERGSS